MAFEFVIIAAANSLLLVLHTISLTFYYYCIKFTSNRINVKKFSQWFNFEHGLIIKVSMNSTKPKRRRFFLTKAADFSCMHSILLSFFRLHWNLLYGIPRENLSVYNKIKFYVLWLHVKRRRNEIKKQENNSLKKLFATLRRKKPKYKLCERNERKLEIRNVESTYEENLC